MYLISTSFSCYDEFESDGSERNKILGQIKNQNDQPLAAIPITLLGYMSESIDSKIMQHGITDDYGRFSFIFSGSNAKYYVAFLNSKKIKTNAVIRAEYAEKTILFGPEKLSNFQIDLTEYGNLDEGVPLELSCTNNLSGFYYFIEIKTKSVLELSDILWKSKYTQIKVYCDSLNSVIVPKNSKLALAYMVNSVYNYDTLTIKDTPVKYILKN